MKTPNISLLKELEDFFLRVSINIRLLTEPRGARASCVRNAGILPAFGVRRQSAATTALWMCPSVGRLAKAVARL